MSKTGKSPKFISFTTQLRILIGFGIAILVIFIVLLLLRRDAEYRSSLAAPLYDSRTDTEAALAKLGSGKAEVITRSDETAFKVKLAFAGSANSEVMTHILNDLDKYNMKAVFFLSGIDAAESGDFVKEILRRGHQIGSRGLRGEEHLESYSQEELVSSFCQTNTIVSDLTGLIPGSLKSLNTEYTDPVLEAAFASGIKTAVDSPYNLDILSFSSYSSVKRYINSRELGSIVTMNISGEVTEVAEDKKPEIAKPAVDKQEDIKPDDDRVDMSLLSINERIMLISEWLIKANAEADYLKETIELRAANEGKETEMAQTLRTTAKASCYLFSGVSSDGELEYLLNTLDEIGAKASFALTLEEAEASASQVKRILERGHELIPRVVLQSGNDYYTVCSRMLLSSKSFEESFGVADKKTVAILSEPTSAALEAASSAGYKVISYQNNITQAKYKSETNEQALLSDLFGARYESLSLTRGQIIHFERGFFSDERMLARTVKALSEHNYYSVLPAGEILSDSSDAFQYPIPAEEWCEGINQIGKGYLPTAEARMDAIAHRYIGTPSARYSDNLPGFNDDERGRIDKKGVIDTKDRVVFLTFDDWGSDHAVTSLLDVLEKYDAKGSFFVVTNYVQNNPNLLRAIAYGGHDIASHTNSHFQLAVDPDGDMVYSSLEPGQLDALQDDVIASWDKLAGAVGDIVNSDGRPVLVKMFRPPTLSVSRDSLGAIFDLGFEYIVSGSYSTHDYDIDDPNELYSDIRKNLKPGAIIVMHMSDYASNTPAALELLFEYNLSLPKSKQYTFARLSDYLDGTYTVTPAY